jgi:hypothetical protein
VHKVNIVNIEIAERLAHFHHRFGEINAMADISSFNPKLAALVARVQGRVPSSNGANADPVAMALGRVAAAEANLESARASARVAAKREGVSLSNLFGDCSFIKRETGERWRDEGVAWAHAEGKQEAYSEMARIFCEMHGADYEAAQAHARVSIEASKERSKRERAEMRNAGFFDAVEAGHLKLAGRILNKLYPPATQFGRRSTTENARMILAAGAKARSDGSGERPDPEGLAKKIIDSGRRRRGEID